MLYSACILYIQSKITVVIHWTAISFKLAGSNAKINVIAVGLHRRMSAVTSLGICGQDKTFNIGHNFWNNMDETLIFCICIHLFCNMTAPLVPNFYAPGLKGPPGASSNRIVRLSLCLSVRLSVCPSVCP